MLILVLGTSSKSAEMTRSRVDEHVQRILPHHIARPTGISSLSWVLYFMEEINVALLHYLANSNVQRGWEVLSWSW